MISIESSAGGFSNPEIYQQLQKIISDRIFAGSVILQKLLQYVTRETLEGRSNRLKEYTIGINVLQKPVSFNPSQDAIVRIHACRLRRALHNYYKLTGGNDPIYISIPKGSYRTMFSNNMMKVEMENKNDCEEDSKNSFLPGDPTKNVVRAHMEYNDDRIRITVSMINIETHRELWNQVMEYVISNPDSLDFQEDIGRMLARVVDDYYKFIKQKGLAPSRIAVA